VHIIGDIHAPLHAGNAGDLGGNALKGTFMGGALTSLHAIWDGDLPRQRINSDYDGNATEWFRTLLERIRFGRWHKELMGWRNCARPARYGQCSDQWARESAKLACLFAYVLPDGTTRITNGYALDQSYYERNIPVIERQLAKAAVRLANVLSLVWPDVDVPAPDKVKWVKKLDGSVRWVESLRPGPSQKLPKPTSVAALKTPTRPW